MRTMVQQIREVRATPIETAVMAATSGRYPASAQAAVNSGSETRRIPTMTGVTSARTPNRRITTQGYGRSFVPPTDRTYQRRRLVVRRTRCGESTFVGAGVQGCPRTGFGRGPLVYSDGPRRSARGPRTGRS